MRANVSSINKQYGNFGNIDVGIIQLYCKRQKLFLKVVGVPVALGEALRSGGKFGKLYFTTLTNNSAP